MYLVVCILRSESICLIAKELTSRGAGCLTNFPVSVASTFTKHKKTKQPQNNITFPQPRNIYCS